ncbi:unnamed protein product [Prorocentrum cordatum]|uniref:DOMON domain-containing protein n=1 Tax=Prorocentrum cordatum TaxID=2364126 RepID=A0ABN9RB06_9DINO|nr:unnamed protein product [Polarella glacialis]
MDTEHGTSSVRLEEGTTRRTLAGEANARGDGRPSPFFGPRGEATPEECAEFERLGAEFRALAGQVAASFGRRLAQVVGLSGQRPALEFAAGDEVQLAELAQRGPRLEHFHSYARDPDFAAMVGPEAELRLLRAQALDFHADQGLFVVFSPGMMLQAGADAAAGSFQIRSADEDGHVRDFDLDVRGMDDVLVVLLGDAVRQLGLPEAERLFHVPSHAFRMPGSWSEPASALQRRMWYGLMQLPPPNLLAQGVLDPATGKKLTFGDIRARVNQGGSGVGCSALAQWSEGPGPDRPLAPRLLEGQCGNGSLSCWHRCMEISLAGVTEEDCSARGDGYSIQCVDQFDQIYVSGHGDFNPTCSNATETVTPRPPVVQPASGEALTDQEWQSLTEPGSGANSDFSHKIQLDQQAGNTVLLWRLVNDTSESGAAFLLHAKMIHRGTVGWMALGLENIGGDHNGMNGGSVVMAQYDPEQAEPLSVGEYRIHPTLTAFRHWKTPLESSEPENASLASSDFSIENGASVLEFRTSHVYKRALNLSEPIDDDSTSDVHGFPSHPHSVNRLIWALTQNAYCTADFGGYCAYHSSPDNNFLQREEFRGRVAVDLARGTLAEAVTTSAPEFTDASSTQAHARVQWAALLVASIMSPWLH